MSLAQEQSLLELCQEDAEPRLIDGYVLTLISPLSSLSLNIDHCMCVYVIYPTYLICYRSMIIPSTKSLLINIYLFVI